jgi:hypothetical protein
MEVTSVLNQVKVKVKLSLYRLCRPRGLHEVEAPRIFIECVPEGGKIVSPKQQSPLTPGERPGVHFC